MVNFREGIFQLAPIVTDPVTPEPVAFECPDTVSTLKKVIIALGTVLCVLLIVVVCIILVGPRPVWKWIREFIKRIRGQ
jgi:hypothetical protein